MVAPMMFSIILKDYLSKQARKTLTRHNSCEALETAREAGHKVVY